MITLDPRNGSQPYQEALSRWRAATSPAMLSTICCARNSWTPGCCWPQWRRAAGMLLQRRRKATATATAWPRVQALAETVSAEELPTGGHLLYRLFRQESVQCFEPPA